MMKSFLYLKGLRHADHTVFCVQEGQKTYYDPQFNIRVPYSSGQQVKRSILEAMCIELGEQLSPVTFNYNISAKNDLETKEPWSTCDPEYADQLLGGWMKAQPGEVPLKRRSPLSVSAMRPLHPLLANVSRENITFDRSDNPDHHPVRVRDSEGNELSEDQVQEFLKSVGRVLPRRSWIADQTRSTGLFVYDVAIDLRTLFAVSMNEHEPELNTEIKERLKSSGWIESENFFGTCLICPKSRRDKIIDALAKGLINWRITSNQARTFSPMETLAIAISEDANTISQSIRARLSEESARPAVVPVIDQSSNSKIFISSTIEGYLQGISGTSDALESSVNEIREYLLEFDYEKQV